MAWISVHEQVIGGKLRTLAKEMGCSQNEALGMLVTLWLWGINNADADGKIMGATREDVAKVLNVGMSADIEPLVAIDSLIATNWIEFDGDLYLHDWTEWQEQWYKAMAIRERDKERKRKERAAKKAHPQAPPVEREKPPEHSHPNTAYSGEFEEWWDIYPRKIGKGEAYKKYMTRVKDGWSPDELKEAAKNYRTKVMNERTDQKYIKHPKTFLADTMPFADFLRHKSKTEPTNDDDPFMEWRS